MARSRQPFGDDRGGQMMLFAGVILVLAFIAMTGAVNRINQLASETVQEQGDPFFLEVDSVVGGVETVVKTMVDEGTWTDEEMYDGTAHQEFNDRLAPVLAHLGAQERSHGFFFSWRFVGTTGMCTAEGDETRVEFTLHDGVSSITMQSEAALECPAMPPPPPPP